MKLKLGAVVLNYNDSSTTRKLIELLNNLDTIEKIVIVDNCSTDNSFRDLQICKNEKTDVIQTDRNGGYGYGNNYGITYLNNLYHPMYILILNPDVEIENKVIGRMIEVFSSDNDIAVVAPFMLNRNGKKEPGTAWHIPSKYEYIFSAGLLIGHFLKPSYYKDLDVLTDRDFLEVDCIAGSLLMVNTSLMIEYGMYDENIFLFGEETSLGCKLKKAGLKTILLLNEKFLHLHGVSVNKSIGSELKKRKMLLNSRKYVLRQYLNANRFDLFLAKIVYGFSIFEYRILYLLKGRQ